jgi:hypothetical protein
MDSPGVATSRRLPAWGWAAIAIVLFAVLAAAWFALLRPGASATVEGVTVECAAATGLGTDECAAWGTEVLAAGPGANVFELEDVDRIAFDRALFGLGDECSLTWFLGRYPDRPALTEEVTCR